MQRKTKSQNVFIMETIKKIKIERVNPENGHYFVTYVDKKEKTKYVNYINDHTSVKTTEVEMKSHHTAIARKYVGVNDEWNEYYRGRFGEGYIIHHPTLRYGQGYMFRGNSYHVIEYIVEL